MYVLVAGGGTHQFWKLRRRRRDGVVLNRLHFVSGLTMWFEWEVKLLTEFVSVGNDMALLVVDLGIN